ncbi:hypothetical protein KFF47_10165 [Pseudomonas fluorescens]|nr:hypothetical protein [Pseudomonas fluorescens]
MLAKNAQTTRSFKQGALSLTSFVGTPPGAGSLPHGITGIYKSQIGWQAASRRYRSNGYSPNPIQTNPHMQSLLK